MRTTALLALLVAAAADKPWMGFAAYPGARGLCAEHVSGAAMHILWRSFAVADEMNQVVAFYERDTGRKPRPGDGGEARFELDADHALSIDPAAKSDVFPSCAEKPKAGERTVILVSTAIRAR